MITARSRSIEARRLVQVELAHLGAIFLHLDAVHVDVGLGVGDGEADGVRIGGVGGLVGSVQIRYISRDLGGRAAREKDRSEYSGCERRFPLLLPAVPVARAADPDRP